MLFDADHHVKLCDDGEPPSPRWEHDLPHCELHPAGGSVAEGRHDGRRRLEIRLRAFLARRRAAAVHELQQGQTQKPVQSASYMMPPDVDPAAGLVRLLLDSSARPQIALVLAHPFFAACPAVSFPDHPFLALSSSCSPFALPPFCLYFIVGRLYQHTALEILHFGRIRMLRTINRRSRGFITPYRKPASNCLLLDVRKEIIRV
jgi:hypothetical protein